ncbi:MAG: DEAD/DEAH box helicase [Caldilineales bacterium]
MKFTSLPLAPHQAALRDLPATDRVFVRGPAGTGKTTAAQHYLLALLQSGAPGGSVLVLTPQRTLAAPYHQALRQTRRRAGGAPVIQTMGGVARRMVELFWPLAAKPAGFAQPDAPPVFLTLETAQYHMARVVRPLLDEGAFDAVVMDPNRLYSQVLDNLNKAALIGLEYSEIGPRLSRAWGGDAVQLRVYADAQRAASAFRAYCLMHNLLDFSLQVEVFRQHLWPLPLCRDHLIATYRHLLVDNVEEETPFAHDVLRDWLPHTQSALLLYDDDAGYRQFLGADAAGGLALSELCSETFTFSESFVTPPVLQSLVPELAAVLDQPLPPQPPQHVPTLTGLVLAEETTRFYPQMLDWCAGEIAALVDAGTPPTEIVVLAPFLSDSLRYSLSERLARLGVPARSHRPSRALRDEPSARALLTLVQLGHPQWRMTPSLFDVAYSLVAAVAEMDLVRAQLLAQIIYRPKDGMPQLTAWERINAEMHERISYVLGGRTDTLRLWLGESTAKTQQPLDHFLSRLFGEILSQRGYGFHDDLDAARVAATLVESVQKFRQGMAGIDDAPEELGQAYLRLVEDGVLAAQYVESWQPPAENAVLLAPAYTFLLTNRAVDYQFWLDIGSQGWYDRLYQPLTQPHVLSRHWQEPRTWTDADDYATSQARLYRLVVGLLRRCRQQVYLGLSELGEQGYEQRGPLLWTLNQLFRRIPPTASE